MLQIRLAAAAEALRVAVRTEAQGIPKPTGYCTPSSSSTACKGEAMHSAQSPQADSERPSWNNQQIITKMSKRPFTRSAVISAVRCPEPHDMCTLYPLFPNLLLMDVDE